MSSSPGTRNIGTAETDQSGTTHPLHSASEATDTKVRTETEDKLWEALRANPNSIATDLSTDARIGRSTAAKILARWANNRSVTRTPGITEGGRAGGRSMVGHRLRDCTGHVGTE